MWTDVDARIADTAARQLGLFTYQQARRAGATRAFLRHRLGHRQWVEVEYHVYALTGSPTSWRQHLLAAVLSAGGVSAASHRSAAQLYGCPGFRQDWLELSVPRGRRPRLPRAVLHEASLPRHHIKIVQGIPTTSVARMLVDNAALLHPRRTERAIDNCLARRLVTVAALWSVMADVGGRGRDGVALMRELLLARGEGFVAPASELERMMVELLVANGLPLPVRELNLGDADGWIGRVDFVYRDAKVLIEVDGRFGHTQLLDRRADKARDNRLTAAGWRILRIDYEMLVRHPDAVVGQIRSLLKLAA